MVLLSNFALNCTISTDTLDMLFLFFFFVIYLFCIPWNATHVLILLCMWFNTICLPMLQLRDAVIKTNGYSYTCDYLAC